MEVTMGIGIFLLGIGILVVALILTIALTVRGAKQKKIMEQKMDKKYGWR